MFRSFTILASATIICINGFSQSAFATVFDYNMGGIENVNTTVSEISPAVKEASMNSIHLDPMAFPNVTVHSGTVKIDRTRKTITLTVHRSMPHCLQGPQAMMCLQMMPAPLVIELPLVSKHRDECGTVIYMAVQDQRPVDGDFQELIVRDTTKNQCLHTPEMQDTEVEYNTESSGFGGNVMSTHSTLSGSTLR